MTRGFVGPIFGGIWRAFDGRASFFPAKNWEIWRASKFCPIFKILPDFQNFAGFSKFCPIFKISPDFQTFARFSKFCPSFKISPEIRNFARVSKFCPSFKISPKFQNFARFSKFCPIFKILPEFQNFTQFSKFHPIFKISPEFQNFARVSKFGPAQTCSSIRVSPNSGWTRPLSVLFYFVPHSQAGSTKREREKAKCSDECPWSEKKLGKILKIGQNFEN